MVPADQLLPTARALARKIAVNSGPAVRMTKRLLREGQQSSLSNLLELSAAYQAIAHKTGEHAAAVQDFMDKKAARKAAKTVDNPAAVPAVIPPPQTSVSVDCPYCKQKQEISVEKGRSGKPFFHSCPKCREEFAVRFEQVTVYRAQVAGFR